MPQILTRSWLVLGGITLPTPAHHTKDITEWLDGVELREGDVQVPFVDGEFPTTPHVAARTIRMEVTIMGDRTPDGVVIADPELGLLTNLDSVKTAWVGDAKRLVTAEVHRADGKVYTGQVRVYPNLQLTRVKSTWRAVVRCRLPAGVLTLVP